MQRRDHSANPQHPRHHPWPGRHYPWPGPGRHHPHPDARLQRTSAQEGLQRHTVRTCRVYTSTPSRAHTRAGRGVRACISRLQDTTGAETGVRCAAGALALAEPPMRSLMRFCMATAAAIMCVCTKSPMCCVMPRLASTPRQGKAHHKQLACCSVQDTKDVRKPECSFLTKARCLLEFGVSLRPYDGVDVGSVLAASAAAAPYV